MTLTLAGKRFSLTLLVALKIPLALLCISRVKRKPTSDGHGDKNNVVLRPDVTQHQIVYGVNNQLVTVFDQTYKQGKFHIKL